MQPILPFFNWSLSKLVATENDALNRARIRILFVILIFSIAKALIMLPLLYWQQQNYFQLARVAGLFLVYLSLLKLLLANKTYIPAITHIMAWLGLFLIWTNIFVTAQNINIITVQFILMLVLSSFYLLNKRFGIIYSILGILPAALYLIFHNSLIFTDRLTNALGSPGFEIMVLLNFITIIITHYLFSRAFKSTIAEKETLNKQLQIAVAEANRASESKSEFLSTMSHELRTPLNSVLGISELMLRDARHPEQEENLKILKYSAENLFALINNILDYNKLDSGKLELETIPTDLAEVVNNVSSGLRFQAKQKGINLIVDIDEAIIGNQVITDPTRLAQIIYNLAGNAIKFTEKGTVTIKLKPLEAATRNLNIRFAIIDTGIGISKAQQSVIFEPFAQASSSTTRKFGGTGLGLAIVKQLLIMFSSSIEVESIPGKGSNFFFDISFMLANENAKPTLAELQVEYDLSAIKILVAEDNSMNRALLAKILEKWDNVPVFTTNGREAIDELMLNNYDVILMDVHMPILNGYEAAQAIRSMKNAAKANIPIIALTAAVDTNLSEKIKEAGMNDYILKPFKISDLYMRLQSLVLSKH